ncbi:hypothetical protein [Cytobacillus purgationiresistens]|uniref:Peroxiredoxin n=1 Tax=Cytobacillus purgationiresistens TaxID=863449 RepID=A0ABU0ACK7_9BACI|nr:hypothetical protein [Cytobacillus purgationiresistens]MDQ0268991.1 peroxiredoxin [Cytobacillus purgationiresistens]
MKRKVYVVITLCILLIGTFLTLLPPAAQAIDSKDLDVGKHPHCTSLDQKELKDLQNKGFKKKDIIIASHIAKHTDKNAEEILAYYKDHEESWKKTAAHFGVDLKKLKEHHKKKEKRLLEHKDEVIKVLSSYSGRTEEEIQSWLQGGESFHLIIAGLAISKVSGTDINDIFKMKQDGRSIRQIKTDLKVKDEELEKEFATIFTEVKKVLKEERNQTR